MVDSRSREEYQMLSDSNDLKKSVVCLLQLCPSWKKSDKERAKAEGNPRWFCRCDSILIPFFPRLELERPMIGLSLALRQPTCRAPVRFR